MGASNDKADDLESDARADLYISAPQHHPQEALGLVTMVTHQHLSADFAQRAVAFLCMSRHRGPAECLRRHRGDGIGDLVPKLWRVSFDSATDGV